jgi:hypothetical protein
MNLKIKYIFTIIKKINKFIKVNSYLIFYNSIYYFRMNVSRELRECVINLKLYI